MPESPSSPSSAATSTGWIVAACFLGFAAVGLLMVTPSLGNPWFSDDLHWFRSYSFSDIASTWTGNNDPLHLEVPGFRPLHAASNYLRYEVFGESSDANRLATVGALALGYAFLSAALARLGMPLALAVAAAAISLLSKNLTYIYAWPSDGYQGLQVVAFGAAVLALSVGLTNSGRRRLWLSLSVAAWIVALFLKDQGILLLPALLSFTALAALGGLDELTRRLRDGSPRTRSVLPRQIAADVWAVPPARVYGLVVTGIASADFIMRRVLVPEAPVGARPTSFLRTLAQTVSLSGSDDSYLLAAVFSGAAFCLFCLVAFAVCGRALNAPALAGPTVVALVAAGCVATSATYGFASARVDLVVFPLYFYGLFAGATVMLASRMLSRRPRVWRLFWAATVATSAVVAVAAVQASRDVQHALGRWSIQTLVYNYDSVYGAFADDVVMPAERRAQIEEDLVRVGISGRLTHDDATGYLYCRDRAEPGFIAYLPATPAWGHDALPLPRCLGRSAAATRP